MVYDGHIELQLSRLNQLGKKHNSTLAGGGPLKLSTSSQVPGWELCLQPINFGQSQDHLALFLPEPGPLAPLTLQVLLTNTKV